MLPRCPLKLTGPPHPRFCQTGDHIQVPGAHGQQQKGGYAGASTPRLQELSRPALRTACQPAPGQGHVLSPAGPSHQEQQALWPEVPVKGLGCGRSFP